MPPGTYEFDQRAVLTATAKDRLGKVVPFTEAPVWSEPPVNVSATVSADGASEILAATEPATVHVTVTYAGLTGTTKIEFVPLPPVTIEITDAPGELPPATVSITDTPA